MLNKATICLCSLIIAATGHASAASTNGNDPAAKQQLLEQMQSVLTQLAASGALGDDPRSISMNLETPARRVNDLGVVIDSKHSANDGDGLRIVATTPGSVAARAGLHPGDVLVAINGTSLRHLGLDAQGHSLALSTLKTAVDNLQDSAPLHFQVDRDGKLIDISSTLHTVYVPAMQVLLGSAAVAGTSDTDPPAVDADGSCGRISSFDVAPRGKHLYHARVLLLDGKTPNSAQQTYRVNPGPHELLVSEDIPTLDIGAGEIATFRRHTRKTLHVDVEPNTTVMIAARLHLDKATQLNSGKYWDPVAWRVVPRACP